MEWMNLNYTKKRLSLIFVLIVFLIASTLELFYFSIKYNNIKYFEKRDFNQITNNFIFQIQSSPFFLDNYFSTNKIRMRHNMIMWWENNGNLYRFLDFVLIDHNSKIYENLNQDISFNIDLEKIQINKIFIENGFFIRNIDISDISNYKNIIFFKKQSYYIVDYFRDLFFFFIINFLFSISFYFIWLFFVNKNLKPVEETLDDMNDFIHNANHELKTPISVISSNLQLLKATKNYEDDLVDNSINEIKRIDNLILELTNLSDIKSISEISNINLENEINEILKEYEKQITGKKLFISIKVTKKTILKANKNYFYIMFSNLLRNAIKHNFESWEINIILDKNKLIISNTWVWISKEDLPNIFDRFFKGEKSRTSEWFGIWLSLVKKICDIYNWEILVSSDKKLTTFEIKF